MYSNIIFSLGLEIECVCCGGFRERERLPECCVSIWREREGGDGIMGVPVLQEDAWRKAA